MKEMDADNRVVLNCGGIRHEVYKVMSMQAMRNEENIISNFPDNSEEDPRHPPVPPDGGSG